MLNVVWMEREFDAGKRIRCLQIASQHVPIYVQQCPSYSNRKCKKSPFSRTAAHIFVSPGDAPATITQYVAWSYTMLKSMRKSKNRYFYHIFVSPGDAPGAITLNVVWIAREFDVTNCLAACAHLSITVCEIERNICELIVILSYPPCIRRPR